MTNDITLIRWLTPAVRQWFYGIWLAASPILVLYGIFSEEAAPLWIALVGAILVPGTAVVHTNRKPRNAYAPLEH